MNPLHTASLRFSLFLHGSGMQIYYNWKLMTGRWRRLAQINIRFYIHFHSLAESITGQRNCERENY